MSELRAGLLQACEDARLFGFELWPKQRELLEAVEAGPRIHAWSIGRRSGKSTIAALVCLWDALLRPELDKRVRPGETRYAVAVATNVNQGRVIVAAARSIVERSPLLAALVDGVTDDEIRFRLPSGARTTLRAFPCSSRGARGWPISTLCMDEAAHFITETEGDRAAEGVWGALVPSTAQFGDAARIILSSTPYGSSGLFHDIWTRAQAGEIGDAVAQHASTGEVNPTITAEFLAAEEARDADSFRSEYLAEFTSSGDAFLDFGRIDLSEPARVARPEDAYQWVCGLDPAFSKDPFGVALVGRAEGGGYVAGPITALKAEGDFSGPVDTAAALAKEYGASVVTDQFSQAAVVERLRHHHALQVKVLPMTAQSKTEIFQDLRRALQTGTLVLPDHPALIAELRRLRTKYTAGAAGVVNPRVGNSHGDMAQALALAVSEAGDYVKVQAPRNITRPGGSWLAPLQQQAGGGRRPRRPGGFGVGGFGGAR